MKLLKDLGIRDMGTYKVRFGLYECPSCGKEFEVRTPSVKSGNTTKCKSCKTIKQNTTHGDSGTRLFNIWNHMRYRCSNPNHSKYKYYGAKGTTVCEEWDNSYIAFKEWSLSNGYTDKLTIDRINNDGNYEPGNCRWTDLSTQSSNTRVIRKTNTSGYRGVSKIKYNKWRAVITSKGNHIHLGCFNTAEEAGYAYDKYIFENKLEHNSNGLYRERKQHENQKAI